MKKTSSLSVVRWNVRVYSISLCRAHARKKDTDQFISLVNERLYLLKVIGFSKEWYRCNQAKPAKRLAEFFKANAKFVDEILGRLRRLGLTVVGQRGRTGFEQLFGDVISRAGTRQLIHKANDSRRVLEQPLFEVVPRRWRGRGGLVD